MEKVNFVCADESRQLFTRVNDSIVECFIKSVYFKVEDDELVPYKYEVLSNDGVIELPIDQDFYTTDSDWSDAVPVERDRSKSTDDVVMALCRWRKGYYFDGVDAKKFNWRDFVKEVRVSGKYMHDAELVDGNELPKLYFCKADVYDYNDISVTMIDGTVNVQECAAKKLRLTEEQQKCVDAFEKACADLKKSGVDLVGDESYFVYVNGLNVRDYDCCENGDIHIIPSEFQRSSLSVYCSGDDWDAYFK